MNFLGDLFINDCAVFGRQLQPSASGTAVSGNSIRFIDAQWPQQQADSSIVHLDGADEVRFAMRVSMR